MLALRDSNQLRTQYIQAFLLRVSGRPNTTTRRVRQRGTTAPIYRQKGRRSNPTLSAANFFHETVDDRALFSKINHCKCQIHRFGSVAVAGASPWELQAQLMAWQPYSQRWWCIYTALFQKRKFSNG